MATNTANELQPMAFKVSNEFAFRRNWRECMRKAPLSRRELDAAMYLLNLWFYHKAKGVMSPGNKQIAKKVGCGVWTVSQTLRKLRDTGVLVVIGCDNGGRGGATRYRLDTSMLVALYGKLPETIEGNLVPLCAYLAASDLVPEEPYFTRDTFDNFTHEPHVNFTHETPSRVYSTCARDARAHLLIQRSDRSQAESAGDNLKAQRLPQAMESPFQEKDQREGDRPINHSLDWDGQAVDTGEMSEGDCQTSHHPEHSLERVNATAVYPRSVRKSAYETKCETTDLTRIRQAIDDAWTDYAATDDVNDWRAWV